MDYLDTQFSQSKHEIDRKISSEGPEFASSAVLTLDNFDRFKQKLFINGRERHVDIFSSLKVEAGKELVVRVERQGRRPFVTNIKLEEDEEKSILVPNQRKERFAILRYKGKGCPKGSSLFPVIRREEKDSSSV